MPEPEILHTMRTIRTTFITDLEDHVVTIDVNHSDNGKPARIEVQWHGNKGSQHLFTATPEGISPNWWELSWAATTVAVCAPREHFDLAHATLVQSQVLRREGAQT